VLTEFDKALQSSPAVTLPLMVLIDEQVKDVQRSMARSSIRDAHHPDDVRVIPDQERPPLDSADSHGRPSQDHEQHRLVPSHQVCLVRGGAYSEP